MNSERIIPRGAGKSSQTADSARLFVLEHSYEIARSCLADAVFVANEREYHGVVALVARAQDELEAIGKLAGIDRSALLDYPVVADDEEAQKGGNDDE